jgi:hypothetical protein
MKTLKILCLFWLAPALCMGATIDVIGGVDVRIGDDTNARSAIFDFDPGTGHYFAVVGWDDGWTFNLSTDGGSTWDHRYRYNCSEGMAGLDMAVSSAGAYVGYTCAIGSLADQAKMRRFELDTGNLDITYTSGGQLVVDTGPATVVDIAVETNIDTDDDRIFYSLIQSDGSARSLWDVPTDGTTFTEVTLDVSNAEDGLDMHWNPGFDTYSLFLSLVDQSGNIQVWRYDGAWSLATSFAYTGTQPQSSISAFGDQVVVAYLEPAAEGQGVQYRQSTNGGTTWGPGTFIAEPAVGQGDFLDVEITARGGAGLAVVYNLEAGAEGRSLFQSKPDYGPGSWKLAGSFNDFDSFTGLPIAINWTPTDLYGVIYVGGTDAIPYFDLVESVSIFFDGFESGDTSAWSVTAPPP